MYFNIKILFTINKLLLLTPSAYSPVLSQSMAQKLAPWESLHTLWMLHLDKSGTK